MAAVSSKSIITGGFITILIILLSVMVLWIHDVNTFRDRIQFIVKQEHEREFVAEMRDSAYRRAIALHRMTEFEDPFDRDEEFIKFRDMGEQFLGAREKLLATEMNDAEKAAWEKTRVILNKGGAAQNEVVILLGDDNLVSAREILLDEVVPTQDDFITEISTLFDIKGDAIDQELAMVTEESDFSLLLILLLAAASMLLAGFTIFVVRRTGKTEDALTQQGERISSLYKVSSMMGVTPDEQIDEMLKLGCRLLDLTIGKVCRIETENNINRVLNVFSTREIDVERGTTFPLNKTFCNIAFSRVKPLAVNNIAESRYRHKPCYDFAGLEAYIAAPIWVHGNKYGTVNFSCNTPRKTHFSDTDKDLVNLIGRWISVTLERKISQEELRVAKDEAEHASQTKSLFLAKMSHELRTPLNAIIGYSEMLKEEATEAHHDDYIPDLDRINSSGSHLLNLINDILDLSKIEAGKMELVMEDLDVEQIIDDVKQTIQPLTKQKQNSFSIQCDDNLGNVKADKMRIKQVLLNLLSNANKFTEQGRISLDTRKVSYAGKDFISFSVIDTGIGINEDQIDKIFQDFSQADPSTASKYGGTGLGLTISKQICQMMGGDITLISEFGKGSTFTVFLPCASQDTQGNDVQQETLSATATG